MLIVDGLKVFQFRLLVGDHFIETRYKVCTEEPMVEYGEAEDAVNEL